MRIFLICLLAAGALAGDAEKPTKTENKHAKRGILSGFSSSVGHGGQQGGYAGPLHQQSYGSFGLGGHSGSGYTSGFGSLPSGHQTFSSGVYDNLGGQGSLHQYGQGSLVSGGVQQFGQGHAGSVSTVHQPIQSNVVDHVVKVPVSVPHPVPVTRTVQVPVPHPVPVEVRRPVKVPVPHAVPVYVTKTYPVNVDRPVPVPVPQPYPVPHPVPVPVSVPHPVPVPVDVPQHAVQINSGYETSVGHQESFGQGHQGFDLGSQQQHFDLGSQQQHFDFGSQQQHFDLGSQQQQHFDLGSQQQFFDLGSQQQNFDFGGQHHNFDVGSQDHQFGSSGVTGDVGAAFPAQHVETSDLPVVTENKSAGYKYDVPAKKFTF